MNEYFEHSGVNGMHWGIRRYQNKDGTWTEEGKRRRRATEGKSSGGVKELVSKAKSKVVTDVKSLAESYEKKKAEREVKKAEKEQAKTEKKEAHDREELQRAIANGDAATILKYRGMMDDVELIRAYQRANTINSLNKLIPVEAKKTKLEMIKDYAAYTKSMSEILTNINNTKKAYAELRGKKSNSGNDKSQNKQGKQENDKSKKKTGNDPNWQGDLKFKNPFKAAGSSNRRSETVDGTWRYDDSDAVDVTWREKPTPTLSGPTYSVNRKAIGGPAYTPNWSSSEIKANTPNRKKEEPKQLSGPSYTPNWTSSEIKPNTIIRSTDNTQNLLPGPTYEVKRKKKK